MKTRKIGILMTIAVTLILLSVVGSASARPPADDPPIPQGAAGVAAVVSPLLQYQGRLTDPSTGEPVADASYSTTFSLYDIDAGGTALWTETQAVQVQGGLFSVALGASTVLDHGLFNGQGLWLGIAVGGDPEATPRQQIVPVAYAMSLVPGATVIDDVNDQPALMLSTRGTATRCGAPATPLTRIAQLSWGSARARDRQSPASLFRALPALWLAITMAQVRAWWARERQVPGGTLPAPPHMACRLRRLPLARGKRRCLVRQAALVPTSMQKPACWGNRPMGTALQA